MLSKFKYILRASGSPDFLILLTVSFVWYSIICSTVSQPTLSNMNYLLSYLDDFVMILTTFFWIICKPLISDSFLPPLLNHPSQ